MCRHTCTAVARLTLALAKLSCYLKVKMHQHVSDGGILSRPDGGKLGRLGGVVDKAHGLVIERSRVRLRLSTGALPVA